MVVRWVGATAAARKPRQLQVFPRAVCLEQERELVLAWRAGNQQAGEQLVRNFLPFVVSIALEYRAWNTPLEDIIQQGCVGLLRAVMRFDPARDVRLVTYAAYWIRAEIRDYVLRSYRMVRLGTTKNERRALRRYRVSRENNPERLAATSGLSVERAALLLPVISSHDASFEQASREDGVALQERIASADPSPEQVAMETLDGARMRSAILGVLAELSSREQLIARERWLTEPPSTLEALGARLGVTKERVRQIEDRTRQKVRARLAELKVA